MVTSIWGRNAMNPNATFPCQMMLHMKFGQDWQIYIRDILLWNCRRQRLWITEHWHTASSFQLSDQVSQKGTNFWAEKVSFWAWWRHDIIVEVFFSWCSSMRQILAGNGLENNEHTHKYKLHSNEKWGDNSYSWHTVHVLTQALVRIKTKEPH